jgi:hypothetical protein
MTSENRNEKNELHSRQARVIFQLNREPSTMEIETTFICSHCLQINPIVVDGTGGRAQTYIEDCQVCCRPNSLTITIDDEMENAEVYAEIS